MLVRRDMLSFKAFHLLQKPLLCLQKSRKITLLLLLCFSSTQLLAQDDLLSQSLHLDRTSGTVLELLTVFSDRSGIVLSYSSESLQGDQVIRFSGKEKNAADYLATILADQQVEIKQKQGKVLLIPIRRSKPLSYTFSGYVREAGSEEALISASISIPVLGKGIYSNEYGFFSLTLPSGMYQIQVSYVGYEKQWIKLDLRRDRFMNLTLQSTFSLESVDIVSEQEEDGLIQISNQELYPTQIEALPMLLGQQDVLKQIQLLPGVQAMNEGVNGLVVRGGNADQNLMLLDDVPIYNPSHSLGLFSVFYGDAIQKSQVMKGAFPAEVGGRLSSVVDVRMKEGSKEAFHGDITTGILTGTIRLEGPIRKKKGKTSFHLSARRTLLDLLTNSIQIRLRETQQFPNYVSYHFQDFNLKIHHQISPNTQVSLSTYIGKDQFQNDLYQFDEEDEVLEEPQSSTFLNWGNRIISLRLNQILSPKWFMNVTTYLSNYRYLYSNYAQDPFQSTLPDSLGIFQTGYVSQTQIRDIGARLSLNYYLNPQHHFKMGMGYIDHRYSPLFIFFQEEDVVIDEGFLEEFGENKTFAQEGFVYLQDRWNIRPNLQLNMGLRSTAFLVDQVSYLEMQPRFALQWQVAEQHALGLSFSRMIQFSHLLTTPGVGLPSDLWVPSTSQIKPQRANHANLAYTFQPSRSYRFHFEAYYKQLNRILDYQQDVSFQSLNPNEDWEKSVVVGKGWGYGLETQIEKREGHTTGWLAYSLGWSRRQFEGINEGEAFPFRLDRRHELTLSLLHKPKPKREWGAVWIFATGQALTLGQQRYSALFSPIPIIPVGPRNGYRAPPYHRLDLSLSLHKQKKRGIRTWIFGLYNVYNRQNPLFLAFRSDLDGQTRLYQQSLLPLLPYATYRFRF